MSGLDIEQLRERTVATLDPLLQIDSERYDRLFTAILTAFVVVIFVLTFQYNEQSQFVPLIVAVPTLLLLLGLFAIQSSERLAERFEGVTSGDILGMEDRMQGVQEQTEETANVEGQTDTYEMRVAALTITGWVLLLFGLVILIGFTVGIPVYLLAYYRLKAELPWSRAIGYTAGIWAFVVVIFLYVLNAPLYPGILGITIPFLR